jgi:hypothetical protein
MSLKDFGLYAEGKDESIKYLRQGTIHPHLYF